LVDYKQLVVEDSLATFLTRGGSIDLGSIAKGYAVDRCVALLESLGAAAGLVDAGGDLRTFGQKPGGEPWRVGLKDPRVPDSVVTVFELTDGAVATSGDYERYFTIDNVRYHHILDPKTGFPATGSCSVTVISREACDADAIATAAFVMGPEAGMRLIESLPDVEGLIIRCTDSSEEIFRSEGLGTYETSGASP
jgi:thiamine biosynthesis lipoprotein